MAIKKKRRPRPVDQDIGSKYGLEILSADQIRPGETNAVIHGFAGSGKTGLLATAPAPLILDFERGARATVKAVGNPDVRILEVNSMEEVRSAFDLLLSGEHPFRTVGLDPIGELQRMALEEVVGRYSSKRQYDDLPSMADWNKALSNLTKIVTAFRGLPMHCVITAHSSIPEHEEDVVKPLVSGKNFSRFLEGAMDLLGYLHIEQDGDGDSVRRLVTRATPTIRAKNRGEYLPTVIEEPNLTDIFALMEAGG